MDDTMVQDNKTKSIIRAKSKPAKIYPVVDHDDKATDKKIRKGKIMPLPDLAEFKRKFSPPQK